MKKMGTNTGTGCQVASPGIYELLPLPLIRWAEKMILWSKLVISIDPKWQKKQEESP